MMRMKGTHAEDELALHLALQKALGLDPDELAQAREVRLVVPLPAEQQVAEAASRPYESEGEI